MERSGGHALEPDHGARAHAGSPGPLPSPMTRAAGPASSRSCCTARCAPASLRLVTTTASPHLQSGVQARQGGELSRTARSESHAGAMQAAPAQFSMYDEGWHSSAVRRSQRACRSCSTCTRQLRTSFWSALEELSSHGLADAAAAAGDDHPQRLGRHAPDVAHRRMVRRSSQAAQGAAGQDGQPGGSHTRHACGGG